MKKRNLIILLIVAIFANLFVLTACQSDEPEIVEVFKTADYLVNDNGYIDYASQVYYNTDTYPELESEGLFWLKFNEETRQMEEYHSTSEEGVALIDTNKPTVIFVHGILYGKGRYDLKEDYVLGYDFGSARDFPDHFRNDDTAYTTKFWLDMGYNVGSFHYEHFADDELELLLPLTSAKNIWHNEGGLSFIKNETQSDGTQKLVTKENASNYSVSQFFAAEYIRAMKALPKDMGSNEIRIACHSMGGVLTTTGVFLLTELQKAGQIEKSQMPDRIAYLDAYVAMYDPLDISEFPISWSGKMLPENKQGLAYVEAAKAIVHYGMAVESIALKDSIVNNVNIHVKEIIPLFAYTVYDPCLVDFTNKHNAVREQYMISIAYEPMKIDGTDKLCICASTPTERIHELMGKQYKIVKGMDTLTLTDDLFEESEYVYPGEQESDE